MHRAKRAAPGKCSTYLEPSRPFAGTSRRRTSITTTFRIHGAAKRRTSSTVYMTEERDETRPKPVQSAHGHLPLCLLQTRLRSVLGVSTPDLSALPRTTTAHQVALATAAPPRVFSLPHECRLPSSSLYFSCDKCPIRSISMADRPSSRAGAALMKREVRDSLGMSSFRARLRVWHVFGPAVLVIVYAGRPLDRSNNDVRFEASPDGLDAV